jgi:hypothetical protein
MFASCDESSGSVTQPDLGLPTDVLDDCWLFFASQLERSTDLGGRAVRPGAFDQSSSGVGIPGFGHRPLLTPLPRGIFRRDSSQEFHACSWGIETGESANCRHHGDGHGAWHTAQGLEGLTHWGQTPRLPVILPFLCETLEAFGVFVHRADVCLQDDWLSRCGTDHLGEPPEMGRAPMSPAGGADIVSEQEGFEATLGVLAIAEGIFTGSREITNGFIFPLGDLDRGEVS